MQSQESIQRDVYFSYGQFMVFDRSVKLPACGWTEAHFAQGFARRDSAVCVRALEEFGDATIRVRMGSYVASDQHARVIAVPFAVTSGKVAVAGPEADESQGAFELLPGSYRLVIAQTAIGDQREEIDLFFAPSTSAEPHSEIIMRDDELNPPSPLVETASIAGEDRGFRSVPTRP
jgi:hypothetical protein